MASEVEQGSLETSPTWAVALVCTIFVTISVVAERCLHHAGKFFRKHDEHGLKQALEKIKEELMLLGFISLLLTVFQPVVAGICMHRSFAHSFVAHMLPCKLNETEYFQSISEGAVLGPIASGHGRKLLNHSILYEGPSALKRLLYSNDSNSKCSTRIYSWKNWEKDSENEDLVCPEANLSDRPLSIQKDLNQTRLASVLLSWMVSFLRQFGKSVTRTEYQTLRLGFINTHNACPEFNFHSYVNRSLQDDFKKVVGISGYLWAFVVIFLLLNVQGWHTYFWMAFLTLLMIVIIGTKLQHIITTLVHGIANAQNPREPNAAVQPSDKLFWFHSPRLVLYLLHFALFQNAYELTFFFWILGTYGTGSCFLDNYFFVVVRLVIGMVAQVICSYSTLPLYALVTQMGSKYKAAIFQEHIQDAVIKLSEKTQRKRNISKQQTVMGMTPPVQRIL